MTTWTIKSKCRLRSEDRKKQTVQIYKNGFVIEQNDVETHAWDEKRYILADPEPSRPFIESVKRNELPDDLLKSPNYATADVDYSFEDFHTKEVASLAWRNHERSLVQLKEYDPNWRRLYAEEVTNIKSKFNNQPQKYARLILETEHIGSTSVEGMWAKPIVDILIVDSGNPRQRGGATTYEETIDILIQLGYQFRYPYERRYDSLSRAYLRREGHEHQILIKEGFIIHLGQGDANFILFRDYLRTHAEARHDYNRAKKELARYNVSVDRYTFDKNRTLHELLEKAIQWYKQHEKYAHIGNYDDQKKEWPCCKASKDERNNNGYTSDAGCYRSGSGKENYHPGRYYFTEYNYVRGWWTCCSQGQNADGCVRVILLANDDVLLTDVEHWSVDNVCRWARSLKQINRDYSENFRPDGIDGTLLLTSTNDEVLRDLGVTSVLHRQLFRKAIDELKTKCSSFSTFAPSVTTEMNKNSYYQQFEGDFTPLLFFDDMSADTSTYPNVSSWELTNQKHCAVFSRIRNWLGTLPSRYKVEKIEFVFNPGRYRMFLGQLEAIENRVQQSAFQPKLHEENSCEERERVLEHLGTLCQQVSHNRRLSIVRMWHGCRRNVLPNLLSDGFAALGTLDDGWYGKAMYFTSSAKYATRYCGESGGCLIMCYVLLLNPFPVVTTDAPLSESPQRFRFHGKGNYKNYQCHYIPVSPVGGANTWDYRPPSSGDMDDALYDELAVFQEANILPQIVIHLQ